ncbi:MAG: carbohydrate-binding family 9-like protein [Planctomycetaceae bacterium]|jgi:hypothetical protein|nr:carbohydrate-binding family 9-like protein [Planctomycetaceae bacterium]
MMKEIPTVYAVYSDEKFRQQEHCIFLEKNIETGETISPFSTAVRVFWTDKILCIVYAAPYTRLTVFEPAIFEGKRIGLWNRDVVEVFICPDSEKRTQYMEFQAAPTGESLDLKLDLPNRDFLWDSHFKTAVHLDFKAAIWTTEMRIPLSVFGSKKIVSGERWRINFYRHVTASNVFLGWIPTMSSTAHIPEQFGILEFVQY